MAIPTWLITVVTLIISTIESLITSGLLHPSAAANAAAASADLKSAQTKLAAR